MAECEKRGGVVSGNCDLTLVTPYYWLWSSLIEIALADVENGNDKHCMTLYFVRIFWKMSSLQTLVWHMSTYFWRAIKEPLLIELFRRCVYVSTPYWTIVTSHLIETMRPSRRIDYWSMLSAVNRIHQSYRHGHSRLASRSRWFLLTAVHQRSAVTRVIGWGFTLAGQVD